MQAIYKNQICFPRIEVLESFKKSAMVLESIFFANHS